VATDKRERQRAARLEKTFAEQTAAKRARTRSTGLRVVIAAVLVLAVLFGVSQLMGDDNDGDNAATSDEDSTGSTPIDQSEAEFTNPELAEEVLGREAPTPEPPPADTAAGALETTTLIEGEGEGAAAGDLVTVLYHGVLADGTTFDESWSDQRTFPVTLGEGAVIAGWDEGLVGAKIGERRHLVIGSDNAYGAQGNPPAIPANAPLAFDVDVVDIQPGSG
jgi:FKBP-type peptidyl-prolyl cis-trans isomerase